MASLIDLTRSDDEPSAHRSVLAPGRTHRNSARRRGQAPADAKSYMPLSSSQPVGRGSRYSPLTLASDSEQNSDVGVRSRRNADAHINRPPLSNRAKQSARPSVTDQAPLTIASSNTSHAVKHGSGNFRRIEPKDPRWRPPPTVKPPAATKFIDGSPLASTNALRLKRRKNALQPSTSDEPARKKRRISSSLHSSPEEGVPSEAAVSSTDIRANSKIPLDSSMSRKISTNKDISPPPVARKAHERLSSNASNSSKSKSEYRVGNGGKDQNRQADAQNLYVLDGKPAGSAILRRPLKHTGSEAGACDSTHSPSSASVSQQRMHTIDDTSTRQKRLRHAAEDCSSGGAESGQVRLSTPMSLQDHHDRPSSSVGARGGFRSSSDGPRAVERSRPPGPTGRRGAVTVSSITSAFPSPISRDSRVSHKSPREHTNAGGLIAIDGRILVDKAIFKIEDEHIEKLAERQISWEMANQQLRECGGNDLQDVQTGIARLIEGETKTEQPVPEAGLEAEATKAGAESTQKKIEHVFHSSEEASHDSYGSNAEPARKVHQVEFTDTPRPAPQRTKSVLDSIMSLYSKLADNIQIMKQPGDHEAEVIVDDRSVDKVDTTGVWDCPPHDASQDSAFVLPPTRSHENDTSSPLKGFMSSLTIPREGQPAPNNVHPLSPVATKEFMTFSEIRHALDKHLNEMRRSHEHKVRLELSHAQFQLPCSDIQASRPDVKLKSYNGMVGLAHRVSPFADMRPIETHRKTYNSDHVSIYSEAYSAEGRLVAKNDTTCPTSTYAADAPMVPGFTGEMPSSSHYVSIDRNILGSNTRQMHVWPYFGMEDVDEAAEAKVQKLLQDQYDVDVNQWPRKLHRAQQVRAYAPHVEAFLHEIGSSMNDILYYLLEPADPEDPVAKAAYKNCLPRNEICKEDYTKDFRSTRWIKVFSRLAKPTDKALKKAAIACTAFSDAAFTHSKHTQGLTMWHIARKSAEARLPEDDLHTDIADVACEICHLHDCPYHGEMREKDTLSETSDDASIASEDALDTDYPPNINYKIPVALPLRSQEPAPETVSTRAGKQQKRKGVEWWLENSLSWDHAKRGPYFPCSHPGLTCDQAECRCFTEKVHCEKACDCSASCDRRFRGCSCRQSNKRGCLQDDRCECWKMNRECDPDLCGSCGVQLALDSDDTGGVRDKSASTCCRNAGIQRGRPRRAILGASKVHGYGLFAGEPIKKDDFVGEYVGEIITKAETERRGTIYDVQKSSYLFVLNRDQELDSQRYGNKIRFINHADVGSRYRNVYPKIMLCNMAHRIGMYALKDIDIGQELFFDYGEQYHDHLKSRALLDSHSDLEDHLALTSKPATRKQSSRPALKGKPSGRSSSRQSSRARSQSTSNKLPVNTKLPAARKSESSGGRRSLAINNVINAGRNSRLQTPNSYSSSRVSRPMQESRSEPVAPIVHVDELMPDVEVPYIVSNDDESDYGAEREVADSEDDDSSDDGDSDDEDVPRRSIRARRRSRRAVGGG